FENAFVGAAALAQVLSRTNGVGGWSIHLLGAGAQSDWPCSRGTQGWSCELQEEGAPSDFYDDGTVIVSSPSSGPDAGKLVLAAPLVPNLAGKARAHIHEVETCLYDCYPTQPIVPVCYDYFGGHHRMTQATLPSPGIRVQTGSLVSLKVVISFL